MFSAIKEKIKQLWDEVDCEIVMMFLFVSPIPAAAIAIVIVAIATAIQVIRCP